MVKSGFLLIFSFPMLEGDPVTALNDPHSVVLTERTARSLFGTAAAMGRMVIIAFFIAAPLA